MIPTYDNGLFISFEGVDGSGKTTQAERLFHYINNSYNDVVLTKEPGGTQLGEDLRQILLHGSDIAPQTEALLFAADRAQHVNDIIRPVLQRGGIIICDRYIDSSLAYQAAGRHLNMKEIQQLNMWATNGLMPNRTYLLDMSPLQSRARLQHEKDRIESADDNFQNKARLAFLLIAQQDLKRFKIIDANQSKDEIWEEINQDLAHINNITSQKK